MFRYIATILVAILLSAPLVAGITPFPASFHTQMVPTNGTSLYVRVGGKGPAVVLLHGFGFTGDMWAPLAIVLAKDHTVIVPDLRGMGMSDHPDTGYAKKNQAVDIAGVMDALKVQKADLVTHDIGNMVGYALAAQYPVRVTRWVVIDAPLPEIGDWDNIVRSQCVADHIADVMCDQVSFWTLSASMTPAMSTACWCSQYAVMGHSPSAQVGDDHGMVFGQNEISRLHVTRKAEAMQHTTRPDLPAPTAT